MDLQYDLTDSVTVVTGATGALGTAVVEQFAAAGGTVAGLARSDPDSSHPWSQEGVTFYPADLTEPQETARTINTIAEQFGRIDAVVATAGTWRGGQPIEETPVEEFELLMDVNLRTVFLTAKYALPELQATGGTFVTVGAQSAQSGGPGDGPYRASKSGVALLTESIAAENRGTVRANTVAPDVINTPANREMMPEADHDSWVTPGEIADVIAFLCSDHATAVTGTVVPVTGD